MARTTDLIASVGVGEDGLPMYPETFITDLTSAYEADAGVADAAVLVAQEKIAALEAENLLLKAHNYELITSAPAVENSEPEGEDKPSDDDPEDEPEGVDSLFGDPKTDK
jgi:hypothetical protein